MRRSIPKHYARSLALVTHVVSLCGHGSPLRTQLRTALPEAARRVAPGGSGGSLGGGLLAFGERLYGQLQCLRQRLIVAALVLDDGGDRVGQAAHDEVARLVPHGTVVGQPVKLVRGRVRADLRDADLDLQRLRAALAEQVAESL